MNPIIEKIHSKVKRNRCQFVYDWFVEEINKNGGDYDCPGLWKNHTLLTTLNVRKTTLQDTINLLVLAGLLIRVQKPGGTSTQFIYSLPEID